jgi:hypothetical protein
MGFWLIESNSSKLVTNIMRQQLNLNLCCVSKTQMYSGLSMLVITTPRLCIQSVTNDASVLFTGESKYHARVVFLNFCETAAR